MDSKERAKARRRLYRTLKNMSLGIDYGPDFAKIIYKTLLENITTGRQLNHIAICLYCRFQEYKETGWTG